jgi:putative pyruvate formate lyase activating enzyme
LSGCDLRCAFCIAGANAFNPQVGTELTGSFLSDAIRWGQERGAINIQWVGGEPTIHIPAILRAMSDCDQLPAIVWKSDFYGTPAAFSLLKGIVNVYVADFKFGNDECAERLAGIDRYVSVIIRNLHAAGRDADLIVRHLLLPGHFDCCYRPIVDYMARELAGVKFSIRSGYLPRWRAHSYSELARPLESQVADAARDLAIERGLNVID